MKWVALLVVLAVAAFLALLLRRYQPEYTLLIGLVAGALVLTTAITQAQPLFAAVNRLLSAAGLPPESCC